MKSLYNLPGVAALGAIMTFLNDNPAILIHSRPWAHMSSIPSLPEIRSLSSRLAFMASCKHKFVFWKIHFLYFFVFCKIHVYHTLVDTADQFYKIGGRHLFIDEVHKYENWSREIKEIYDLYRDLHIVISGSSLLQINDGQADLSRRLKEYSMPGLSFREYLAMNSGISSESISLEDLLSVPNHFCTVVKQLCHPLEHFKDYLKHGYYPFYFENKKNYQSTVESVINYIIDTELTKFRGLETGNSRRIKTLLKVLSQIVPYEVDISKFSSIIGIQRPTTLKYLKHLEEASLIHRLFTHIDTITDFKKPDKILLDNSNLLYTLSEKQPEIGTVRETFFCNQLHSAGHRVEYGGLKSGDFRIDGNFVIEVGGHEKGLSQVKDEANGYIAADDIDSETFHKIPLWAFGFLY